MPHTVDMAQNLLGSIESVSAEKETFSRERPEGPAGMGTGHFVVEGGELGTVENEDYASSLVRFAAGARGTLENSRTCVGPHVRNSFEVNGTRGALSWNFQRLNELGLYRFDRSEEHTSELQSRQYIVCRLLLEKKKYEERKCTRLNYNHDHNYNDVSSWTK